MAFGKKRWGNRSKLSEDTPLQITSMADIFTILLVFLLKSYSTGAVAITPGKGVELPSVLASEAPVDALKVEIGETSVSVEGEAVATLEHYKFQPGSVQANGVAPALSAALEKQRKKQLLISSVNTDVKVDPKVLVISDQHVPYSTVKTVLAAAALNGYTDFKLAVVNKQ